MVSRSDQTPPLHPAAARSALGGIRQPLRLVGVGDSPAGPRLNAPHAVQRDEAAARRGIAHANLDAAINHTLDPQDPRWQVALETASSLEGSLLTFERRRKVLAFAHRVGVRPFDANLIIAAVQDRARRGESPDLAMETVALTALPARPRSTRQWWPYATTAVVAVAVHAGGAWFLLRYLSH